VLLAGIIRILSRGENAGFRFGRIDRALLVYTGVIFFVVVLRAPEQLTVRLGGLYDTLFGYFVFRCLLRDEADFRLVLAKVAYVVVPFALLMVYEATTNRNLLSFFHGVAGYSWVRNGHTRAMGPFRNPITAGSFGATFAMLFASLWFSGTRKRFVLVGFIASALIVFSSHSSGPFLGLALGLLAFFCWRWRQYLKHILWSSLGLLIFLQLIMNAPVWFLIGRISEITGGGGYHRAMLIEQAVHYFDRWWLAGTVDTADWFPYSMNGKADITNFFVASAVDAGLLGLFAAIALVVIAFKSLGRASLARPEREARMLLWGVGATLVGSLGILFSVTYMDQMQVIWYYLLASLTAVAFRPVSVIVPSPVVPVRAIERFVRPGSASLN
jgi:hypothetical protein